MPAYNNEEAISDIVGILLMVAVAVALGGIIGVSAFNMADKSLEEPNHVAVSAKRVAGGVEFTNNGVMNRNNIAFIRCGVIRPDGTLIGPIDLPSAAGARDTVAFDWDVTEGQVRAVASAAYTDGTEVLLLDIRI
ncbi:MAG: type IV pilin N-terminal domain-containing protein [Methanomicrobiaceae archaeon]|nr:type IV pilin N-terminal domain-containing protein [Methanomicrobiaceae archaeon]